MENSIWGGRQTNKYRPTFPYSSNTCCQAPFLICAMLLTPLMENPLFLKPRMNIQQVPDTQQHFTKKVMMQVHGKENTGDYFPKSAAEEYTLNFKLNPLGKCKPSPKQPFFFSMCFIYNSLNAAGNMTFK